jgi:vacuolar protein-sorting-associated protein 4
MSEEIKQKLDDVRLYVSKAQEADKAEDYPKSARMWDNAIKMLNQLIRVDPNKYNVETYKKKVEEYTKIMEEVKKKRVAEPEGGKKDSEDDKLAKQLSGTLITETPNVKWEDVAGLEKAKEALKEAVVLPIKFPQLFQEKRKPWKGILLYGPPGTGKSYLAKAAATETGGKFFSVSAANIVSKWMGESEKLIKGLFDLARQNKPAVIFLDEIDSVLSARSDNENDATRRLKTEFLIQMQGVGKDDEGVLVLGATNIPWGLDPAVRRRFQKKIYISLPDVKARRLMFTLNLGDTENDITDKEFDTLAEMTEGYSGSDIATLTQDAIYGPLRKCQRAKFFKKIDNDHIVPCSPSDPGAFRMTMNEIEKPESLVPPKVTFEDYIQSIQKIKATVNQKDLEKQEEFTKEFGQEG